MTASSPALGVQAASDEIGEQVGDDGLFSVSPSHTSTGTLVPSAKITRATTQHWPTITSPSIITTATSSPLRSRAISSLSAVSVARTQRQVDVVAELGVSAQTASRWYRAWEQGAGRCWRGPVGPGGRAG
jgi:hypothetical protein